MRSLRRAPARRHALLAALLMAAAPGCATVGGGGPVWIGVDGDQDCRVEAAGRHFALPGDEARLATRLRRLARRTASALMSPPPARTGPGCWDAAIALVRAAGFRRIGFFSTDPPPDARVG